MRATLEALRQTGGRDFDAERLARSWRAEPGGRAPAWTVLIVSRDCRAGTPAPVSSTPAGRRDLRALARSHPQLALVEHEDGTSTTRCRCGAAASATWSVTGMLELSRPTGEARRRETTTTCGGRALWVLVIGGVTTRRCGC